MGMRIVIDLRPGPVRFGLRSFNVLILVTISNTMNFLMFHGGGSAISASDIGKPCSISQDKSTKPKVLLHQRHSQGVDFSMKAEALEQHVERFREVIGDPHDNLPLVSLL